MVLTLALAIGATTAVYSIAEGVLLEPLPYPDPDRIVLVLESNPDLGYPRFTVSAANFRDFQEQSESFERMAAAATLSLNLVGSGEPERLFGLRMTADFLPVLGATPLFGRPLLESDDRPGATKVVLLSHSLWQRRFGGREEVLDEVINLSGEPYQVIGVMPKNWYFTPRDFFIPAAIDFARAERGWHDLVGFGRLKPEASVEQAQEDLAAIASRLGEAYPDTNEGWTTVVERYSEQMLSPVRPALLTLLAAVGIVLVIAALNTVNLMLARLATREREVAVRLALGASRAALARTFLVESVLLTLAAGALGLFLAVQGTRLLLALYGDGLPRGAHVGVDSTVLLFALGITLTLGVVLGLVPAVRASRTNLREALAAGGGQSSGRRSHRVRQVLVFTEVALSLVLLIGAGLLIRSFTQLAAIDPGFDTGNALSARFELPQRKYGDEERRRTFYRDLFSRLETLPGATGFAVGSFPPMSQQGIVFSVVVEGRPPVPAAEIPLLRITNVSPGYFG